MEKEDTDREFWDEVLVRRILEETPPWERQSLELVCRRMYLLSQQTPYKRIANLHLFLERVACDDKPNSFKIFMKTYDSLRNKFEKIKNSTQIFSSEEFQTLESYLLKFHTNITKLTVNGIIEINFFKIFDFYLKNVEELNCKNFSKELIESILTSEQTLTKQIKNLRLTGMDIPENCDFLTFFPDLQKLYLEENRCSRNVLFSFRKRQYRLELISLKEDREYEDLEEEWNIHGYHVLDELEHYSKKIEFINLRNYSTNPFHLNISLKFENLTCLELSFLGFNYREIRTLIENVCLMKVEKLTLKDVHFNRRLFTFHGDLNSTLKELNLENWISLDGSHVYLGRLVKESLKILRLRQLDLTDHNFGNRGFHKLCPNLEEIEYFPRVIPSRGRELIFCSVNFYNWLWFFRKIERITSSVPLRLSCFDISIMRPKIRGAFKNLKALNITLYNVDTTELEKKLHTFYGDRNGSEYYIGPREINSDFPTVGCGFYKVAFTFPPCTRNKHFDDLKFSQCKIPQCGCSKSR